LRKAQLDVVNVRCGRIPQLQDLDIGTVLKVKGAGDGVWDLYLADWHVWRVMSYAKGESRPALRPPNPA
jgi:hypothetical protein